jgi:UDP-N-acetylmuramoyl-tripeptide--D-alanyl-D-alanine ligase
MAAWSATARPSMQRVHTDTRTLQPGDLFVALKGERFDANDFIAQARDKGAVAAIAQPGRLPPASPASKCPTAGRAGRCWPGWRRQFAAAADRGHRQQRQDHRHADGRVHPARLAARQPPRHPGQPEQRHRRAAHAAAPARRAQDRRDRAGHEPSRRDRLPGRLAQPTVALVNNAQREHQEFMATVEAVAARTAACSRRCPRGVAVFPAGDVFSAAVDRWAAGAAAA